MNATQSLFLSVALVACGDSASGSGGNAEGGNRGGAGMVNEGGGGSAAVDPAGGMGATGGDGAIAGGNAPLGGMGSTGGAGGAAPSEKCVTYCDEFMPNCNSGIANVETYDDLNDCLQTCETFAHGASGTFVGDTVECRVDHLTFDPTPSRGYYELHCFHAQEHPTSQCI